MTSAELARFADEEPIRFPYGRRGRHLHATRSGHLQLAWADCPCFLRNRGGYAWTILKAVPERRLGEGWPYATV